jgi:hypothetical protein
MAEAELTGISYNLRLAGVDYMVIWSGGQEVNVLQTPSTHVGPITTLQFDAVREDHDGILKPRAARKALAMHLEKQK